MILKTVYVKYNTKPFFIGFLLLFIGIYNLEYTDGITHLKASLELIKGERNINIIKKEYQLFSDIKN